MSPVRIAKARKGDVLVEPGGRWPWDAWEVAAADEPDLTEITRPYWYHSWWGHGRTKRMIANRDLAGWRRVKPREIFKVAVATKPFKTPVGAGLGADIWILAVLGDGAIVFAKQHNGGLRGMVTASEDVTEAIGVAEGLTRFELPPLDAWISAPPDILEPGYQVYETATPGGNLELTGHDDGSWTLNGLGFRQDQNTYWAAEKAWQDAQEELALFDPSAE